MSFVGNAPDAVNIIADAGTVGDFAWTECPLEPDYGPGAMVAAGRLEGEPALFLINDAHQVNPRFRVVYGGVIGLEEAYKFALAVYRVMELDKEKPPTEKRPIILVVDTPGNGAGKLEEILGMNKATAAYQLALAEARKLGHPVVSVVVGRAISGGFLCHGLQADRILALGPEYGTMVHVMPLTSIARVIRVPLTQLEELAEANPVFAAGVPFFYRLGGVDLLVDQPAEMRPAVLSQVAEIRRCKAAGEWAQLGPVGRGWSGWRRGGRQTRQQVLERLQQEGDVLLAELRQSP